MWPRLTRSVDITFFKQAFTSRLNRTGCKYFDGFENIIQNEKLIKRQPMFCNVCNFDQQDLITVSTKNPFPKHLCVYSECCTVGRGGAGRGREVRGGARRGGEGRGPAGAGEEVLTSVGEAALGACWPLRAGGAPIGARHLLRTRSRHALLVGLWRQKHTLTSSFNNNNNNLYFVPVVYKCRTVFAASGAFDVNEQLKLVERVANFRSCEII